MVESIHKKREIVTNEYPLQLLIETKDVERARVLILQAQRDYAISSDIKHSKSGLTEITITCNQSNFALAYYHIGFLFRELFPGYKHEYDIDKRKQKEVREHLKVNPIIKKPFINERRK